MYNLYKPSFFVNPVFLMLTTIINTQQSKERHSYDSDMTCILRMEFSYSTKEFYIL